LSDVTPTQDPLAVETAEPVRSRGPERMCAVTRQVLEPDQLIRFVAAPDGTVVADIDHKLPGRGMWLACDPEILEKAIKNKVFSRSLKASVQVPDGFVDGVAALLRRRLVATLSMANKAGLVLSGFQKVDAALEKGSVSVLVAACDAAVDGRAKLDRKFQAIQRDRGVAAPVVTLLTIDEISLAIGRPSVVHAALTPGGLSRRFVREAERLQRFCASPGASGQEFQDRTSISTQG